MSLDLIADDYLRHHLDVGTPLILPERTGVDLVPDADRDAWTVEDDEYSREDR